MRSLNRFETFIRDFTKYTGYLYLAIAASVGGIWFVDSLFTAGLFYLVLSAYIHYNVNFLSIEYFYDLISI